MAVIQIEVDDTGKLDFSKLPEAIRPAFQDEFNRAYAKGAVAKANELKELVATPEDKAELQRLREETRQREIADDVKAKEYEKASTKMREDHQKELDARQAEITRREERIRKSLGADVRAAALKAGAREDALDEIVTVLGPSLDLDADFNAIVKGADGKPLADKDGKPVSIDGLVGTYLESKPFFKKAAGGQGGGARGGRSTQGTGSAGAAIDQAVDALKENPMPLQVGRALASAGKRA